jgi:hypothetical protein
MMATIDQYSLTSLPLTLLCKGKIIGSATGFFYKVKNRYFLVSNWHVFSGRNANTGQTIRNDAGLPDTLRLAYPRKDHLGEWIDGHLVHLEANHGTSTWLQHPKGQEIDVAAVPIDAFPDECTVYELPRPIETTDMAFRIGMDAYIMGFPKGISHQKFFAHLEACFCRDRA